MSEDKSDGEPDMDAPEIKPPQKKKRGGKVHGGMPKKRLDKKARGMEEKNSK